MGEFKKSVKQKIIDGIDAEARGRSIGQLTEDRDATLMKLLKLLHTPDK